ncbi:tail fiber assembly protein [Siccibacter turicensis]|uniref:tail fiber assembly protein n=1 Tax=Siccibacter turicensis TaxID=357233 RepID=UPI00101F337C|nr:tail fiber assembly protein [Siccibacter turicensis]
MEKYLYSALSDNFYLTTEKARYIANGAWPSDGIEVSEAAFVEFTQAAPAGKIRGADKKGRPAWMDAPSLTLDEMVALDELKKQRMKSYANAYINEQQWAARLSLGRITEAEKNHFNQWLDYLDALEAIDVSDAPDILWPTPPVEQAS